jgi:hypothetical protein
MSGSSDSAVLTAAGSETAGKTARRRTPRSSHAAWDSPAKRPDAVKTLERQDETRVADLVPIRHGRMLASAFTFYRGAAAIMAADLAATPDSGLWVQLCGDAHLSNFGVFAAPDRRLIFDINDFDETHLGPFEWDVKRLVASFAIGGRNLGFKESQRRSAVAEAASEYRREMRRLASMRTLDVWYERLDEDAVKQYISQVSSKRAKRYDKIRAKAERKNSMRALGKLVRRDNGELRIISDPPLIVPIEEFFRRTGRPSRDASDRCSRPIWEPSTATSVTWSRATATYTRRTRSSGWVASEPGPGSCSSSDPTRRIPSSCRSRRPSARCSSRSPARRSSSTKAVVSSRASG